MIIIIILIIIIIIIIGCSSIPLVPLERLCRRAVVRWCRPASSCDAAHIGTAFVGRVMVGQSV